MSIASIEPVIPSVSTGERGGHRVSFVGISVTLTHVPA
jgi:hypothetical protein